LPAPGCGPEQLRVFHSEQCIAVHLQNMHLRICAAIKLCSVRHSSDSLIIFSKRSLTVLKKATALNLKRTIRSQVMFTEPWPESLQHGASRLCRGLDIVKNSQTCNNLYCFIFQFGGGLGASFGEAQPTEFSPVATGQDVHLADIRNKQAGKYKLFIHLDRYGFTTCEKLTH